MKLFTMGPVEMYTQALCADFRTYLPALGLSMPAFPCSAAMTTVMFGDIPATLIYETLKKDFDIFVTPSGGALKDVIVRVGHVKSRGMGNGSFRFLTG